MSQADLFTVAAALRQHARPDRPYRDVIRAVQGDHPGLSREMVLNAAFFLVSTSEDTPEEALRRVG